jgi:tol-pal system protein YbgF
MPAARFGHPPCRLRQNCAHRGSGLAGSIGALVLGATALLAGVLGCARPAEERHLDAMREEIDRIEQDRDSEIARARLTGEGDEAAPRAAAPRGPASGPTPEPVSIGYPAEAAVDDTADTEDPAPRPSIRILGTPRPGGHGMWRGDDRVEQSGVDDGSGGQPSALDPEAPKAYDAALALVSARKYDAALDALAAFLVKWPDHPYANNAMYWRGECYFARGDYVHAREQFAGVVDRFPAGNKAPDALLKLGMSAAKAGDPAGARDAYARLARDYPQSQAAHKIPAATGDAPAPPGPSPQDHR